ncbi:hypothetical protein CPB85DRAFT_1234530, partial [Mucidula mucida]
QDRLREELSQFSSSNPTYDQLTSALPYLDAVVHGTLRTHPPILMLYVHSFLCTFTSS